VFSNGLRLSHHCMSLEHGSMGSCKILTVGQWAMLRHVALSCPLPLRAVSRRIDLRRLLQEGFVCVKDAKVCATRTGIEALWYHCLH